MARLLFIGLWTIADKAGRLEDRPLRIKAQLFPYEAIDTDALLNELQTLDVLDRYTVDNKGYIQITNFAKHQKPHPKEMESTLPAVKCREKKRQSREKVSTSKVVSCSLVSGSMVNSNGDKSIVDSDESTAHKISHSRSALATEVFEYWRTELGKNGTAKFDVKRRRLVESRLADNDVEFIKQAIRGIKHSAFHMGENEQRKVYDGLNLICRDQEKLESFAALDEPRRPRATESPPFECRICRNTGTITGCDPADGYKEITRACGCEYGLQRRSA